jgi:hypothetical protein
MLFILITVLYLILGFGFNKVMQKCNHPVPAFINLITWPVVLAVISIHSDWD